MKIFEGKSPAERNKIILAIVLGVLALLAVSYNLVGLFSSRKTNTAISSPTPALTASKKSDTVVTNLPPQSEIDRIYETTPVIYPLISPDAPEPGRNIFAFYEPPVPTPFSPTPTPEITPPTPIPVTPTPPAPQKIYSFNPASVYAGTGSFTLDIIGEGFTPDTRIYFNGMEMPTNFISPQRISTNVLSNLIQGAGQRQIYVRTPDGKLYSYPVFLDVQPPPRPQFQYVGIIAPRLGNNATAYIQEGSNPPVEKRLGETIGNCGAPNMPGCFVFVSISREKVIVQDRGLGFRYSIEMAKPAASGGTQTAPVNPNPNFPGNGTYIPYPQQIPGIPSNIQPYIPPNRPPTRPNEKKEDVDDEDGNN